MTEADSRHASPGRTMPSSPLSPPRSASPVDASMDGMQRLSPAPRSQPAEQPDGEVQQAKPKKRKAHTFTVPEQQYIYWHRKFVLVTYDDLAKHFNEAYGCEVSSGSIQQQWLRIKKGQKPEVSDGPYDFGVGVVRPYGPELPRHMVRDEIEGSGETPPGKTRGRKPKAVKKEPQLLPETDASCPDPNATTENVIVLEKPGPAPTGSAPTGPVQNADTNRRTKGTSPSSSVPSKRLSQVLLDVAPAVPAPEAPKKRQRKQQRQSDPEGVIRAVQPQKCSSAQAPTMEYEQVISFDEVDQVAVPPAPVPAVMLVEEVPNRYDPEHGEDESLGDSPTDEEMMTLEIRPGPPPSKINPDVKEPQVVSGWMPVNQPAFEHLDYASKLAKKYHFVP